MRNLRFLDRSGKINLPLIAVALSRFGVSFTFSTVLSVLLIFDREITYSFTFAYDSFVFNA